jgi:hypothetical protein
MRQFSWLPLPEGYHLVAAELLTGGPALPGAACLVGIRPAARRMWPASPGLSRAGAGLARRSAGRSGRTGPAGRLAYRAVRCGAGRGEGLVVAVLPHCSLDEARAIADEHSGYCGPADTRSMHSDDTHSRTWFGLGLTSKARGPIY